MSLLLLHQEYSLWSYPVRSHSITFEVQRAVSSRKPHSRGTRSRRQGLGPVLVYCVVFTPPLKHLRLTGSRSSVSLFFATVPRICCKAFFAKCQLIRSPRQFWEINDGGKWSSYFYLLYPPFQTGKLSQNKSTCSRHMASLGQIEKPLSPVLVISPIFHSLPCGSFLSLLLYHSALKRSAGCYKKW